ncbi:MAG: hypothetical protein E7Z65_03985 [Thermoplasmata archaeon]|nr:hypothetical protein [Thermoplasmata archaeon]
MVGRLGTQADVLMTESILGRILETIDSMLLEGPLAGIMLSGERLSDADGDFTLITGMTDSDTVGMCFGSSEGGIEPTDDEISIFRAKVGDGIMMKADVYSHQFSLYKISEELRDAKVLFLE